jgi:hypothetical protein
VDSPDEQAVDDPADIAEITRDSKFAAEFLLSEYKALRDEILKKMDHRTSMVVCSVTVSSAVLGFGIDRKSGSLLLVSPLVSLLLGMLILFHNVQIGETSEYLRQKIEDRLAVNFQGFSRWHGSSKSDPRFRIRKGMLAYHLPLILIAVSPAVVAIPLALANISPFILTMPVLVVDVVLLAIYAALLVKHWKSI